MKEIFKTKIERPLANAHMALLVLLIFLCEFILFFSACDPKKPAWLYSIITAVIFIHAWSCHIALRPIDTVRKLFQCIFKVVTELFLFVIILIVIMIPLVLVSPTVCCYTPRTKVVEMLVLAELVKPEVESRIMKRHDTRMSGDGLEPPKGHNIGYSAITADGTIILVSKEPSSVVIQAPSYVDGRVIWSCSGYPERYMPTDCKH